MSVQMLTAKELAEALKVTTKTLREWDKLGNGPRPLWIGPGTIRYLESDVATWLAREKLATKASNRNVDAAADDVETE